MIVRTIAENRLLVAVAQLPRFVRWGGAVMTAGGVVDVVYHAAPGTAVGAEAMGSAGHGVTLAGMVIAMVGVVRVGLAQRPANRNERSHNAGCGTSDS